MRQKRESAVLVLENGEFFTGRSFGYNTASGMGEVCFNTSMTGYQEILTDPSYKGQIVTLTYPMIGNYGINSFYNQSSQIQASGLIVKEYVDHPSNHVSQKSLREFLLENQTPAMEGIDTRKLVLILRSQGAMRGGIFLADSYSDELLQEVRRIPSMEGQPLAGLVSTKKVYRYGSHEGKRFRIAVLDYGVKTAILHNLDSVGFAVDVLPADSSFEDLIQPGYDCFFLSNGPGDPEPLRHAIEITKKLLETGKPIFGICLGHQILGLANGHKTYKLKFGHRGGNQPVKNMISGSVEITAQNHGFAVAEYDKSPMELSYINLNDHTIEGYRDRKAPVISVQYHPEAAPGPNDAVHMFRDFYSMVESHYAHL
jgi:carbamoyl-phosphate synthase small subunit